MEDKNYSIELEVVTPLSVGAGNDKEWIKGIDFVQKNGKVYVIDIRRAATYGVDVGRLTELFLRYDEKGIVQLLGSQLEKVSIYVFDAPVKTDNNIKAFLRTQLYDRPLVAGSSIKGAIRSALFKFLRVSERTNEDVFGTMKDGTDFMRFIRVGDIEMSTTFLANSKIFNLRGSGSQWEGGWKHGNTNKEGDTHTTETYNPVGFNTLYECVAPGQKGVGSIMLAANAFDLLERFGRADISHAAKKHELINAPVSALFKVINDVTLAYLRKERKFFNDYPADRTDEIISNIDYLITLIPSDGSSCLMKMSAGVGFHSITGDWQFDDYDKTEFWERGRDAGKKKYKSRKTVEYNGKLNLMGFVRLRALSAAETEANLQRLQQEHDAIKEQITAPILKMEEERKREEEANAERIKAAAEEARKRAEYDVLIEQARQLFNACQWEAAIVKAEDASALNVGTEHQTIIQACKNEMDIQKANDLILGGNAAFFQQSLADALAGKTSVGNIIGTLTKWLKGEGNTFAEEEQSVFMSALLALPEKERKKLSGKRKDLAKVIGDEESDKLLTGLGLK